MTLERYASEVALPAYAFVPGRHPHPVSDVRGHSVGRVAAPSPGLDPNDPRGSRDYLYALDLFNAGFYWEAHEAWEGLWNAAGRAGHLADFLKGLIKLAAAGVKAREGQAVGVLRHAVRAGELFEIVQAGLAAGQSIYAGLVMSDLIRMASQLELHPIVDDSFSVVGNPVLPYRLTLVPC